MCLSTVYKKEGGENVFLCKNVARVIPKGDEIALYDLMGNKYEPEYRLRIRTVQETCFRKYRILST